MSLKAIKTDCYKFGFIAHSNSIENVYLSIDFGCHKIYYWEGNNYRKIYIFGRNQRWTLIPWELRMLLKNFIQIIK